MTDIPNSLPPLPISTLRRVQRLQKNVERELNSCHYPGTKMLDVRKALEILRTGIVEELNVRLDYFETLPGFKWEWMKEIIIHAAASVLACFPQGKFEKLDESNTVIGYEGDFQFIEELIETAWSHAVSRRVASQPSPSAAPVTVIRPEDRKELVAAYRQKFPDVKIADIIWAAQQTRREWTRWISGQVKDGHRPDRSFRHVLTSGKKPEEIMGKSRPTKYNV